MWLLAGTMQADRTGAMKGKRSCVVPNGRALLVPIVNSEMSPMEDTTAGWPGLNADASRFIDDVTVARLTVDGNAIVLGKRAPALPRHDVPEPPPQAVVPLVPRRPCPSG